MQPASLPTLLLSLGAAALGAASAASPPAVPASSPAPAACALPSGPLPSRTRAVFVLDTSGSMRGIGDGQANIFGRVKGELNRYVRQARPDRVELMTFDAGLRSRQGFDQPAGTTLWNTALNALKADGNNTYLYRSLRAALEPLSGAGQYVTTVFVLTDGIDNDSLRPFTAAQALAAFGARGPYDQLHYLALGTQIPADARQALENSTYADGLTVPLNQVPQLDSPGLGSTLVRVTDLNSVAVPLADGTQVQLATQAGRWGLQLNSDVVRDGQLALTARGHVPHGAAALLCAQAETAPAPAGPPPRPGRVATRPQRVLLRLNPPPALQLLNPGADLSLAHGEDAVLRYRAPADTALDGLRITGLPPELVAQVTRLPGAQTFVVRLSNRSLAAGQTVTPLLTLSSGSQLALPAVQGRAGGRAPYPAPSPATGSAAPPPTAPQPAQPPQSQGPSGPGGTLMSGLVWLLGLAAAAALVAWLGVRRRGGGRTPGRRPAPSPRLRPTPSAHGQPPAVEGIEYSEGRVLSLVTATGEATGVPIPLGGPFDLGQLARVPHLSGLRAEQHRDGLRVLRVPLDLEVSQGARLVSAGDVVRPGTLLGVAVARAGRAPRPPLGALAGLGLPLTLRHEAAHVRAAGPYGQHAVTLTAGLNDLGSVFGSPVLGGLKVTLSGPNLLLVEVPLGLGLRRNGETAPLQPGSYLPDLTLVDLPDT